MFNIHRFVNGEGAPQRHQGLGAVAADEALLVEEAVALVGLQHLGTTEQQMLLLCSRFWKSESKESLLRFVFCLFVWIPLYHSACGWYYRLGKEETGQQTKHKKTKWLTLFSCQIQTLVYGVSSLHREKKVFTSVEIIGSSYIQWAGIVWGKSSQPATTVLHTECLMSSARSSESTPHSAGGWFSTPAGLVSHPSETNKCLDLKTSQQTNCTRYSFATFTKMWLRYFRNLCTLQCKSSSPSLKNCETY